MEYSIGLNDRQQFEIEFSMEHCAFARWFNDELGRNLDAIDALLKTVLTIEAKELNDYQHRGREFQLLINDDEVQVQANGLDSAVETPDDTELYDSELKADCGLADFKDVLLAWRQVIKLNALG